MEVKQFEGSGEGQHLKDGESLRLMLIVSDENPSEQTEQNMNHTNRDTSAAHIL